MTQRQRAVFDLLASGLAPKQVAHKLGVSYHAVYAHRARIMRKMGCRTGLEFQRTLVNADDAEVTALARQLINEVEKTGGSVVIVIKR